MYAQFNNKLPNFFQSGCILCHFYQQMCESSSCFISSSALGIVMLFSFLSLSFLSQFSPESRPTYEAAYTKILPGKWWGSMDPHEATGWQVHGHLQGQEQQSCLASAKKRQGTPWVMKFRKCLGLKLSQHMRLGTFPYAFLCISMPPNTMSYS